MAKEIISINHKYTIKGKTAPADKSVNSFLLWCKKNVHGSKLAQEIVLKTIQDYIRGADSVTHMITMGNDRYINP